MNMLGEAIKCEVIAEYQEDGKIIHVYERGYATNYWPQPSIKVQDYDGQKHPRAS